MDARIGAHGEGMKKSCLILLFSICFIVYTTKVYAYENKNGISEHPIFKEIKNGNLNEVQRMIDNGLDINYRNNINETLLNYAVANNQEEIVQFLLDNHADVEIPSNAQPPIVSAAQNRNLYLIKLLLKYGANINSIERYGFKSNGNGESAILAAIVHNDFEIVDFLLSNGADINLGTFIEGDGAAILLVSDRSARIKSGTRDGDLKMLDYILSKGFNPNQECYYGNALSLAVKYEDFEAAQVLLKYNAEINEYVDGIGMTIKELVEKSNNAELISLLSSATKKSFTNIVLNKIMTVSENLKLRSAGQSSANVLTVMSAGTKLKVLELGKEEIIDGINSNWVKVEIISGNDKDGNKLKSKMTGWCYGGYLE